MAHSQDRGGGNNSLGAGGHQVIDMKGTVNEIKALLTAQKAAEWLAESSGMEAVGKTERR